MTCTALWGQPRCRSVFRGSVVVNFGVETRRVLAWTGSNTVTSVFLQTSSNIVTQNFFHQTSFCCYKVKPHKGVNHDSECPRPSPLTKRGTFIDWCAHGLHRCNARGRPFHPV